MEKTKTNLLSLEISVEEFIEEVCRQIDLIREHHFTAKLQANFLKELKSDLKENCSFVVQDAVQGVIGTIAKQLCIPLLLTIYMAIL